MDESLVRDRPAIVTPAIGAIKPRVRGGLLDVIRKVLRRPLGAFSVAVLAVLVIAAVFADVIGWRDPTAQFRGLQLSPPMTMAPDGAPLLLGGDELGRDLFSRIVHGARISMYVGLVSVFGALLIGSVIGLLAGYFGGSFDVVFQRVIDMFMSIPVIVLAMVIATVLGAGVNGVILAIVIIQWPRIARVVRGDVLLVKQLPYVEAARSVGVSNSRIISHHVLRNVTTSLIILATTNIGAAIIIEAALAFLAIGATPPTPSWGLMITDAREYLTRDPKLVLIPSLVLSLVVLAFNLGGDVLRDVLDPRMKGSGFD